MLDNCAAKYFHALLCTLEFDRFWKQTGGTHSTWWGHHISASYLFMS